MPIPHRMDQSASAITALAFDDNALAVLPESGSERFRLRARLATLSGDAVFVTREAALYTGIGGSTWERMRMNGETPAAIRLTGRTLGYRKRVLDAWLDARTEQRGV